MIEGAESDELLAAALDAAAAASALLAGVRPARIETKSHAFDLVTEHDIASERLIRERLAARAPAIGFLGEETGATGATGARRWLVDPIDGTVNFAHGVPVWSVSIALEDEAGIAIGVVVAPALDWWFWARRGGGAWMRSGGAPAERLAVSRIDALERAMLATGFPYDRATNPDNNFAEWDHFQRVAGACRRFGVASLDLCMVARGWFDGYWERRLSAWDLAAGALLVVEAGGRVTDTRGGPFDPHAGEAIASNGGIHDAVIANLAEVGRSRQN